MRAQRFRPVIPKGRFRPAAGSIDFFANDFRPSARIACLFDVAGPGLSLTRFGKVDRMRLNDSLRGRYQLSAGGGLQ